MTKIPLVPQGYAREAGLKRFFTGIKCRNGHIAERYASEGSCVECVRERAAKYITPARQSDYNENKMQKYHSDPEFRTKYLSQCKQSRDRKRESAT